MLAVLYLVAKKLRISCGNCAFRIWFDFHSKFEELEAALGLREAGPKMKRPVDSRDKHKLEEQKLV